MTNLFPLVGDVKFDFVEALPTGVNPTTVNYRQGGSSGTIVMVLTITYDAGGNWLTVTKTVS